MKTISPLALRNIQQLDWVIVGAETGNRKGKVAPDPEWIKNIVDSCRAAGVPVFMKDSLTSIVGPDKMIREFPTGLKGASHG